MTATRRMRGGDRETLQLGEGREGRMKGGYVEISIEFLKRTLVCP